METNTYTFNQEPDEVRVNDTQRTIKMIWRLGPGEDHSGHPCEHTAQLFVSHDKDYKHFSADLRRIDLRTDTDSPFRVESFMPFGGTSARLPSIHCARYSRKGLDEAAAAFRLMVQDPEKFAHVCDPNSPA